ncbi:hypothetical protein J6590_014394 [Homalodisca vitripennis]|nr:hypothetical protein J6590_014394 [Homalodisca vitripennis]
MLNNMVPLTYYESVFQAPGLICRCTCCDQKLSIQGELSDAVPPRYSCFTTSVDLSVPCSRQFSTWLLIL